MTANVAAMVLVVLGAVIAILGFLLAANMTVVVIGLLAVFGGGILATLDKRRA